MEGGSEPLKKPNWVKPKQENRPLGIKKSYPKMSTVTKRGISEVPYSLIFRITINVGRQKGNFRLQ